MIENRRRKKKIMQTHNLFFFYCFLNTPKNRVYRKPNYATKIIPIKLYTPPTIWMSSVNVVKSY